MIGSRCTHSNVFSRGVLIRRFLLGILNVASFGCDLISRIIYNVNQMGQTALFYLVYLIKLNLVTCPAVGRSGDLEAFAEGE